MTMAGRPTPARRYLDGLACAICGREDGPMIPVGDGPRGQLFAHPESVEPAEAAARMLEEAPPA